MIVNNFKMRGPVLILLTCASYVWTVPVNKALAAQGSDRIIGGSNASDYQFIYAASITYHTSDGAFFCGGTLITDQWVATAGQCVFNAISFDINLGTVDRQGEGGQSFTTDHFMLPPEFSSSPIMNDIGLIKLTQPVILSAILFYVNNIASEELPDGYEVVTIGWGATSDSDSSFSPKLRWTYVTTISNDECKVTYGDQITDEKVCVVGNPNEGTCVGDMGGPLIWYPIFIQPYLVGISSFLSQNGCENSDPSGFTRVDLFHGWIQNVTAKVPAGL